MPKATVIPKFGQWDPNGPTYTVFFENARVKKGSKKGINPNDPEFFMNEESIPADVPEDQSSAQASMAQRSYDRPRTPPKPTSNNDSDLMRSGNESEQITKRASSKADEDAVKDRENARRFPVHNGSSSHDLSQRRPVNSNSRQAARRPVGDESPAAFPKFDELDMNNMPEYTMYFNKLHEEKTSGHAPSMPARPTMPTPHRGSTPLRTKSPHHSSDGAQKWWCCFRSSDVYA